MRRQIAVVMCSAVLGLMTVSSHAVAQQKTVKACQEEWRANKAANQANGVTEKAYVAQCRGGAAPAQTTAAPAPPPAPAPAPTAAATGQKTAKECREEWRANKAANQANGVTEKAYVAQCRGGAAPAQTTAAPAPPPAPARRSDSSGYGTKDCKGMPGRVESQQGRQSGQRRYGKGLRSSMPRRCCTRSNHCGPGTTAGCSPCSYSGTGCSVQARPPPPPTAERAPGVSASPAGRTNFQPKRRLRPAAPLIPLCGSI